MSKKLLFTHDVAAWTGYSVKYIQKLAREDMIPNIRIGREYRFQETDVEGWLASITYGGASASLHSGPNGSSQRSGQDSSSRR